MPVPHACRGRKDCCAFMHVYYSFYCTFLNLALLLELKLNFCSVSDNCFSSQLHNWLSILKVTFTILMYFCTFCYLLYLLYSIRRGRLGFFSWCEQTFQLLSRRDRRSDWSVITLRWWWQEQCRIYRFIYNFVISISYHF